MANDDQTRQVDHATTAGICLGALVVAVAVSLGYYQFVYVPQANVKPIFANSILFPKETIIVRIVKDAVLESNTDHFKPTNAHVILGLSNRVEWINNDSVRHTVTADEPQYADAVNGNFDSLAHPEQTGANGFLESGGTWSFTFTKVGEYAYHCSPHPWMKGEVAVVENFS